MFFDYLLTQNFPHVPEYTDLINDSHLIMDAFKIDDNWVWEAPNDETFHLYTDQVLKSLHLLGTVPPPPESYYFPERILTVYMEEGWQCLDQNRVRQVQEKIGQWSDEFHPQTQLAAQALQKVLPSLVEDGRRLYDNHQPLYLAHHDARQANITWHANQGVKLIDWSWADLGFYHADTTMFLIDLAKSDHDISSYLKEYFNPDHAMLIMGHWLGRCLEPTREGNDTVRFHQLASAITSFDLLREVKRLGISSQ